MPDRFSGGVGVMQVSEATSGIDQQHLLDPGINIDAGAGILGKYQNEGLNTRDAATKYNGKSMNEHAQRYGGRVESYVNNQTYTSNAERIGSALNAVGDKLKKAFGR